ncbi:MAG: LamG-like jellyroll fold domain-containing protein [Salibacteraceae bacterium]
MRNGIHKAVATPRGVSGINLRQWGLVVWFTLMMASGSWGQANNPALYFAAEPRAKYVELPVKAYAQDFTWGCWVKAEQLQSGSNRLISIVEPGKTLSNLTVLLWSSGKVRLWAGNVWAGTAPTACNLDQWYQVFLFRSGYRLTVYLVGVVVFVHLLSISQLFQGNLRLGDRFTGYLDEISFWNKALTVGEIMALNYQSVNPNVPGLEAYFDCGDKSPSLTNQWKIFPHDKAPEWTGTFVDLNFETAWKNSDQQVTPSSITTNGNYGFKKATASDYLALPDFPLSQSAFSVEMEVNPKSTADEKRLLSVNDQITVSETHFYVEGAGQQALPALNPDQPNHVVLTFSNGQVVAYVNGVRSKSISTNINLSQGLENLQVLPTIASGEFTDAVVDEILVWDKALNQFEVAQRRRTAATGTEPGLLAYYDFEEDNLPAREIGNSVSAGPVAVVEGNYFETWAEVTNLTAPTDALPSGQKVDSYFYLGKSREMSAANPTACETPAIIGSMDPKTVDEFTLEFWCWAFSFTGTTEILTAGIQVERVNNQLRLKVQDGNRTVETPLWTPAIGKAWNHIAVTYQNKKLRIYFNGVEAGAPIIIEQLKLNPEVRIGTSAKLWIDNLIVWEQVRPNLKGDFSINELSDISVPDQNDLLAFFDFDNPDHLIYDRSKRNGHLTVHNYELLAGGPKRNVKPVTASRTFSDRKRTASYTVDKGRSNAALCLDFTGDTRVEFEDFQLSSENLTIQFMVRPTAPDQNAWLIKFVNPGNGLGIKLTQGKLNLLMGNRQQVLSPDVLSVNEWHLVTLVYNSNEKRLYTYLDGEWIAEPIAVSNPAAISRKLNVPLVMGEDFVGQMENVDFMPIALTPVEVADSKYNWKNHAFSYRFYFNYRTFFAYEPKTRTYADIIGYNPQTQSRKQRVREALYETTPATSGTRLVFDTEGTYRFAQLSHLSLNKEHTTLFFLTNTQANGAGEIVGIPGVLSLTNTQLLIEGHNPLDIPEVTAGEEQQVALVFDHGKATVFVNKKRSRSIALSSQFSMEDATLRFGKSSIGTVDNIYLFDRAFNEKEIQQWNKSYVGTTDPTLIGYYNFNGSDLATRLANKKTGTDSPAIECIGDYRQALKAGTRKGVSNALPDNTALFSLHAFPETTLDRDCPNCAPASIALILSDKVEGLTVTQFLRFTNLEDDVDILDVGVRLFVRNKRLGVSVTDNEGTKELLGTTQLKTNTNYQVVFSTYKNKLALFLNNAEEGQPVPLATPPQFAPGVWSINPAFNGYMDVLMIFEEPLSFEDFKTNVGKKFYSELDQAYKDKVLGAYGFNFRGRARLEDFTTNQHHFICQNVDLNKIHNSFRFSKNTIVLEEEQKPTGDQEETAIDLGGGFVQFDHFKHGNTEFTIDCWIKDGFASKASIIDIDCPAYRGGLSYDQGFLTYALGNYSVAIAEGIVPNAWNHVTFVCSANALTLMVNGKKAVKAVSNFPTSFTAADLEGVMKLGEGFNGLMDNLAVLPYALSERQLVSNYYNGVSFSNAVEQYDFNQFTEGPNTKVWSTLDEAKGDLLQLDPATAWVPNEIVYPATPDYNSITNFALTGTDKLAYLAVPPRPQSASSEVTIGFAVKFENEAALEPPFLFYPGQLEVKGNAFSLPFLGQSFRIKKLTVGTWHYCHLILQDTEIILLVDGKMEGRVPLQQPATFTREQLKAVGVQGVLLDDLMIWHGAQPPSILANGLDRRNPDLFVNHHFNGTDKFNASIANQKVGGASSRMHGWYPIAWAQSYDNSPLDGVNLQPAAPAPPAIPQPPVNVTREGQLSNNAPRSNIYLPNYNLNATGECTVEGWVNFATTSGPQALINAEEGKASFAIGLISQKLLLSITDNSGQRFEKALTDNVSANVWHHYAVTMRQGAKGMHVKTWLDGVPQKHWFSDKIDFAGLPVFQRFGFTTAGPKVFLKGQLDDTRIWTKALTHSEVLQAMHGSTSSNTEGLSMFFNFNQSDRIDNLVSSGASLTLDEPDLINLLTEGPAIATRNAALVAPATAGSAVQSYHFSTAEDRVILEQVDFAALSTITIEAMVKLDPNNKDRTLFSLFSEHEDKALIGGLDQLKATLQLETPNDSRNSTYSNLSTPVPLGKWTHLCYVINTSGAVPVVKVYKNGLLETEQTLSGRNYSLSSLGLSNLLIGAYENAQGDPNFPLVGQMDYFRIWNRELTANELRASIYNRQAPGNSNLIAALDFNQNNQQTALLHEKTGTHAVVRHNPLTSGKFIQEGRKTTYTSVGYNRVALLDDKSEERMVIPVLDFTGGKHFSIDGWFYFNDANSWSNLVVYEKGNDYLRFVKNKGSIWIDMKFNGKRMGWKKLNWNPIQAGKWMHLCVSLRWYNSSISYLYGYVDGNRKWIKINNWTQPTSREIGRLENVLIGCGSKSLNGKVDYLRFWDGYFRTSSWVIGLKNNSYFSSWKKLRKTEYRFDDGEYNPQVWDHSGNGNHAYLLNGKETEILIKP